MASITSLRVAAYPNGRPAALDLIGTWQFGSQSVPSGSSAQRWAPRSSAERHRPSPISSTAYEPWRAEQAQDWTFAGTWFGDQVNVLLPTLDEFASRLTGGDFAWWSPYNSGGAPLAGVGDDSVFLPLILPYLLLPLWFAPAYSHLLVIIVTIVGIVLFLRRLGLAGQHELILEYEPPGQRTGFLIAGASALVLMAIGAWDLHRRHRARTDGSATGAPP